MLEDACEKCYCFAVELRTNLAISIEILEIEHFAVG